MSLRSWLALLLLLLPTWAAHASVIVIFPGGNGEPPPLPDRSTTPTGVYIGPGTRLPTGEWIGQIGSDGVINGAGRVAFRALVGTGGSTSSMDETLLVWDDGSFVEIVREGDPGRLDAIARVGDPVLNERGEVAAIVGEVYVPVPGGPPSPSAVLRWDGATASFVGGSGMSFPNVEGPMLGFSELALADSGALVAMGWHDKPGFNTAIVRLDTDEPLALASALLPSFPDFAIDESGAAYRNSMRFAPDGATPAPPTLTTPWADRIDVHDVLVDDAGALVVSASAYEGGSFLGAGIFRIVGGDPVAVAFAGDASPVGLAVDRLDVSGAVLGSDGTLAFTAEFTEGGIGREALFVERDGVLREVIRVGAAVGEIGTIASLGDEIAAGPSGLIAFDARVTNGGTAVFLTDGGEVVRLVGGGSSGNIMADDADGEGTRLVTGARLEGGQDPGGQSRLNARGQVALVASDALVVVAPDLHWRGGETGEWEQEGAWTLGIRPEDVHAVAIDPAAGGQADVSGPASDSRYVSLEVGSEHGGAARLDLAHDVSLALDRWVDVGETGRIDQRVGTLETPEMIVRGTLAQLGGRILAETFSNGGYAGINGSLDVLDALENQGTLVVAGEGRVTAGEYRQHAGDTVLEGQLDLSGGLARIEGGRIGGSGEIEGGLRIGPEGWLSILLSVEDGEVVADALRVSGVATLEGGFELVGDDDVLASLTDGAELDVLSAGQIDLPGIELLGGTSTVWSFSFQIVDIDEGGQVLRMTAAFVPEPRAALLATIVLALMVRHERRRSP